MKKDADVNHVVIVKKIDGEVNGLIIRTFERQPTKKRLAMYKSFVVKDPFKKDDEQQKDFLQGLRLLTMKN